MIKVMIVDDELLIRVGIKSTVQWNKLGLEVIAEAENGKEALEKFSLHHPEIIITDIRMPVMDGLELIKDIKQLNLHTKFIILTCYGEFSYAKEALRLGAFEYIVKPTMMADDLEEVLSRVVETIHEEQKEQAKVNDLEKKFREEEKVIKENTLLNIIHGVIEEGKIGQELDKAGLPQYKDNTVVIVCQVDDYADVVEKYSEEKLFVLWGGVQNIAQNVMDLYCNGKVLLDQYNKCIGIVGFPGKKNEKEIYENIYAMAKQVRDSIEKYLGIHVTIGLSDIGCNEKYIYRLFQQANTACEFRMFLGGNKIISYHKIVQYKQSDCEYEYYLHLIETEIRELNGEQADKILKDFFLTGLLSTYNKTLVKKAIFKLLALLTMMSKGHLKDALTADMEFEKYEQIMKLETLEQMYKWFKELLLQVINTRATAYNSGYCIQVKKATEYIKNRYMDEISLDDAAEAVNVSRNYLGNLFKRDTGKYFIDFLMEYRIEKAKELLKECSFKIYEVALKVGIKDQRYFSKVFKKYTGCTPNEYRDNIF